MSKVVQTSTQEFTVGPNSGVTVLNSSNSTGVLTLQCQLGNEWVPMGVVPNGSALFVDVRNVVLRCAVSGTVFYGVV